MTTTYKTETVEEQVVQDVLCNGCGKSCFSLGNVEALSIHETWGYGSPYDGQVWDADLCAKCSIWLNDLLISCGGGFDKTEVTAWGDPISTSLDKEN